MEDAATRTAAATDAWQAELYALKRKVYSIYLGVSAGIVALLLVVPITSFEASTRQLTYFVVPIWVAVAALLVVAMLRRPSTVVFVERAIYALMYPTVIGTGVALVATSEDPGRYVEYVYATALWLTIGFVWSFVAFGSRRGLLAAGALLATFTVAIYAVAAFGTRSEALAGVEPVDLLLVATSATLIVALYVMSAFIEVQARGRAEAETLARFATVDALTGLPNRRALDAWLANDLAAAERDRRALAVCFADLDDLKRVNDTYGHRGGDELISQYAERLRSAVRATDVVARISGDEFVVTGFVAGQEGAAALARKLLGATAEPFTIAGDHVVAVGSSIGVSVYPDDATEASGLLRRADIAMYDAKLDGKNRWRSAGGRRAGRPAAERRSTAAESAGDGDEVGAA